ncbi:hypothetical protein NQ163_19680 [Marinifilum sp. D737]|nr:hypothetical protein [Marinifilum sp. D737]
MKNDIRICYKCKKEFDKNTLLKLKPELEPFFRYYYLSNPINNLCEKCMRDENDAFRKTLLILKITMEDKVLPSNFLSCILRKLN